MTLHIKKLQVLLFLLLFTCSHLLLADEAVSLQDVIRQTLDEHPDVKAAYNRMQAEKSVVKQAKAGMFPTLDLQSGWGKQQRNGSNMNSQELSLSLRQPLFEGHAIEGRIERSGKLYLARRQEWHDRAQETAIKIVEVYCTVLEKREQLALAERNHAMHEKTHDQIRQRVHQGLASDADLFQMQGRTALAGANLMVARNNLVDAESQYMSVVSQPAGELMEPELEKLLPFESLGAARQQLIMHPKMQVAILQVDATESAYQISRSAYYPTLNLEIDRRWNQDVDEEGSDDNFQAMLRLRYNLFRGGADKAAVSESAYLMAESEESREKVRRQLNESLELAWASYRYLERQMPFLENHVTASRKTQFAYEQQFSLGQRGLLDLLDSANELFRAHQSFVSARYEFLYSKMALLNTTGSLLSWFDMPRSDN